MAMEAAQLVLRNACMAHPLARSAEPLLKPNQPNHRRPDVVCVGGGWGGVQVNNVKPGLNPPTRPRTSKPNSAQPSPARSRPRTGTQDDEGDMGVVVLRLV